MLVWLNGNQGSVWTDRMGEDWRGLSTCCCGVLVFYSQPANNNLLVVGGAGEDLTSSEFSLLLDIIYNLQLPPTETDLQLKQL